MGVLDENGQVVTKKYYNFIQDYSEGLAVVGQSEEGKDSVYGYIDQEGNEVILPQYIEANSFKDNIALVKVRDGEYKTIDKSGKMLSELKYPYVYGYGDGRFVYTDSMGGAVGYIDIAGKVVIPASFEWATPFEDGVAVVTTFCDCIMGTKALINLEGNYIYANIYNDIKYLGEDRVALGKALDEKNPFVGSIYAIGDTEGNILTEFRYYGVDSYKDGKASAYDETSTFFIDLNGNKINDLPTIEGSGTLTEEGRVIKGNIDYQVIYLRPNGEIIYVPNALIPLAQGYQIEKLKYKPNINYLVYYPRVDGVQDPLAKDEINAQLEKITIAKDILTNETLDYNYYENFAVQFYNKDLLVLDLTGSTYYFGAAHPMPNRDTPSINLVTGEFYKLQDLFNEEKDWKKQINLILEDMVKTDPQYKDLFEDTKVQVQDNQPFYVDQEAVYIYYAPYEIGPYAAGYVTFKIPYTQIEDILNKEGSFWKAYH